MESECKTSLVRLKSFNGKEHRLDELFFHCLDIQKCKDLSYVVKFTLNHGQTPVERGFNIIKSFVKVNMNEETIVVKIIHDYILGNS